MVLCVLCSALFAAPSLAAPITVLTLKGPINPVAANYLARGIREAEKADSVLVLRLDTPGGLDNAMRDMVQSIRNAKVPVVVYVAPTGARAASAGMFITVAAPVNAMAPGTAIGAAHPVGGQGEEIQGSMKDKVTNDAAAYAIGLAKENGRNADWVEQAVRKSISAPAQDAVRLKVVDLIAKDLDDLKQKIDGRKIKLGNRTVTLATKNENLRLIELTPTEQFLYRISDPTIAFILLNLGMMGLFFELSTPGAILPGVIGGICLLLATFALGMLPVNFAGLLLIALAFILFIAEVFVPGFGALTVGGVIALILGGLMLFNASAPELGLSIQNAVLIAVSVGAFFFFAVGMGLRAQKKKVTTGEDALIGHQAEAKTSLDPEGTVFLEGERWNAIAENGPVAPGEKVIVTQVDGLLLHVKRKEP